MAKKKREKGLWLLLLGGGAAALLALGKKPAEPGLGVVSVVFNSGPFTPGSLHQVVITVRNTGTAPASGGEGSRISIMPDVGSIDISSALSIPLAPGQAVDILRDFFILPDAVPGTPNTWGMSLYYDGKTLTASGIAFAIEAPLEPFLELVPPIVFA